MISLIYHNQSVGWSETEINTDAAAMSEPEASRQVSRDDENYDADYAADENS